MVTTRSMEEEQHTRDLIAQMQAQIQAQARTIQAQTHAHQEMQRRHAEEITMLRAERGRAERSAQHLESIADRGNNQHNDNAGSRNQQPSRHTDPNDRGRREPSPLRTDRPSSLLPFTAIIMQTPMPEKNPPVLDKSRGKALSINVEDREVNSSRFLLTDERTSGKSRSVNVEGREVKTSRLMSKIARSKGKFLSVPVEGRAVNPARLMLKVER
ncbi:hypothetical protein LR48_Vigan07g053300 [Vigna angularis]|uniref:Uncharacterized protein n=1 Tax=Phaseolus angularis TaxID=3914 RepID=A0A0L9UWB0_PHAAN|nr:hypothetical protein LR48_Vigan07g053300 [Vigna angularis]